MVKGHHEPRSKAGTGKQMVPGWVHGELTKLINSLDGKHAEVVVAAVALLGQDGFDVGCAEQTTNFDAREYGPVMIEGYAMIAAAALGKLMAVQYGSMMGGKHPINTQEYDDPSQKMIAIRQEFDTAIRQFMRSMFGYLGAEFQHGKPSNPVVAGGSQVIAMWQKVCVSTIKFTEAKENKDENRPAQSE